jgi:glycosyltransferase involved in cell wall biosynthesis
VTALTSAADPRARPAVLHLIGTFHQGGSERQALQLARLLAEDGRYTVQVACLRRDGPLLAELERWYTGEVAEFPLTTFHDRNAFVQVRRLGRLLRERRVSVVQTHDFYTNVFGVTAAALARVPVRIAARRETAGVRTPLQLRVERAVYRLAHAVVVNADAVGRQLRSEGLPAKKIVTVYNGVDLDRVAPAPGLSRADRLALFPLPAEPGRRLVTIVANLRLPVKDHATFLRAAARVRAAVPEAAFVLAGEGELAGPVAALAEEAGLRRHVFLVGRCERLADLLAISEVCVLSSRAEGFSNAILEYMAAGRVVVATDVGGAREAVVEAETGHLVAPGDDEGMAARIIELLREPARARRMGERGRQVVEARFSVQAQLDGTRRLYDRLLAATRPSAVAGSAASAS